MRRPIGRPVIIGKRVLSTYGPVATLQTPPLALLEQQLGSDVNRRESPSRGSTLPDRFEHRCIGAPSVWDLRWRAFSCRSSTTP